MNYSILLGRSVIAVNEFPDYVQGMCEEDEDNSCKLAYEYWVSTVIRV